MKFCEKLSEIIFKGNEANRFFYEILVNKEMCNIHSILHGGAVHLISQEITFKSFVNFDQKYTNAKLLSMNTVFISAACVNDKLIALNTLNFSEKLCFSEVSILLGNTFVAKINLNYML